MNVKQSSILIVEDDPTTAHLISSILEKNGHFITGIASCKEEALDLFEKKHPQLALMDITLGDSEDGIELAAEMFDLEPLAVVFVTSSADEGTISRATSFSPYGYIIKPVDRNELITITNLALARFTSDQAIIKNEEKYSTILSSITDAVIVSDLGGVITYMNKAAEILTGCSLREGLNKNISSVIKIITDDSRQKNPDAISRLSIHHIETRDNRKIPVELYTTLISGRNNVPQGTVTIIRDNTQRLKYEKELHDTMHMLRQTMSGTIQAMVQTVECRDPYTAGHQRRVADLARHIAEEMDLTKDNREGIRLAGVIHDLGKISIPAEILSKPGRLLDVEFNLIKLHPQIGYDILKTVEFPWPVADIVHQHHEKLDGSGYPQGLKGDEILLEAKIISVADVVEAMASHRPYRAALGIEIALKEIEKHSGTYFEPDIVGACKSVFTNEEYVQEFTGNF